MSEPASSSLTAKDAELRIPELEGRARLRRVLLVLAIAAAAVAAYLYYTRAPKPTEMYRTVPVVRRTLVQAVEAAGRLDVQSRVEVPAPAAGRLVALHVTAGDSVQAGQLLAELDPRAATLAVRGAQASVEAALGGVSQATAARDAAQSALDQARKLLARGLAAPQDVSNAEAELSKASAAVDAARGEQRVASESVASAKLGQNLSRMVSPSTGVVLKAPERLGAAVSPDGGPLFVIGDPLAVMRVDATVSETEVAQVKAEQSASVFVAALPGQSFPGRVQRVFIEPERRDGAVLYPVRLTVQNPDGVLLPGMTARARMEVARAENVLSVHEAALRFLPPNAPAAPLRSRVFRRVDANTVEAVNVRALVSDGVYAQIEVVGEQKLNEKDELAVGLTRPEGGSSTPQVTLGDKKK